MLKVLVIKDKACDPGTYKDTDVPGVGTVRLHGMLGWTFHDVPAPKPLTLSQKVAAPPAKKVQPGLVVKTYDGDSYTVEYSTWQHLGQAYKEETKFFTVAHEKDENRWLFSCETTTDGKTTYESLMATYFLPAGLVVRIVSNNTRAQSRKQLRNIMESSMI